MNVKKTKSFKENRPENYHVHDSVLAVYHYQSAVRITVLCLVFGAFLSSLIGEMDDKEREREEN